MYHRIFSPSDRPIILVFRHQGSLCKSEGVTSQRGRQIQGGSDFRPVCGYILETVKDRGIVTMEDEYKVVCALVNGAVFDDLEWPRTLVSRSQYSLKANISQTVHPIHFMFGSSYRVFGVDGSNGAIFCSIKSKMAADGHGHLGTAAILEWRRCRA